MKKVITILLLTLAAPAFADHHIGHAFTHLDEAERQLGKVSNAIRSMPDCSNWTETQLHFANDSIEKRRLRAIDRINDTREDLQAAQATWAMIQGTTGDTSALEAQLKDELFAARSHLTQPAWPNNGNQNSAEFETGYLVTIGKYFIEDFREGPTSTVCPEASNDVAQIMLSATVALRWVNIAAWHVFDATNEMVYKDEDFVCAGPNNHCE